MKHRTIAGWPVGAIGLGAMPMSLRGRPDRPRAMATIHAALDAGITLIDTADAYCTSRADTGHNERLVAEALRSRGTPHDEVLVATKGGHVRPDDGSWIVDGRPEHLRAACEASLKALDVDVIDLYQLHRPDPAVAFADSVGALADLREEGKVRLVGLSNVDIGQIDEACAIVPVASVQNQLSPAFRSSGTEVAHCQERGIAFLAWAPLGGTGSAAALGSTHRAFAEVAHRHGVSPQQVALAWSLAQGEVVIPIPGASRPATITDSARAAELALDEDELTLLGMVA
ncbi:MAG TPA: aldo/keto reductase [Acidimicrobiales bacterium]|nr:aldo/keto reductase [Acidimicrobiales bacterium]